MKYKALFFDIDGTLVSFATHRIPRSAVDALREAKKRAVRIFIATGRPRAMVNNLGEIEDLIDGWITHNGGQCTVGDEVIRCNSISPESLHIILDHSDRFHYPVYIVGEHTQVAYNNEERMMAFYRDELNFHLDTSLTMADLEGERVIETTNFCNPEQERDLMPRLPDCISTRWHPAFIDITERHSDKGTGLAEIAAKLGIGIDETMAFGDGGNDASMLRAAGVGVALGSAFDEAKRAADYITTTVEEDGVARALEHFGVI